MEKLLFPTEITKMAIWSLQQDDNFYSNESCDPFDLSTGSNSLWNTLCTTLSVTDEQKGKIIATRARFGEIWSLLQHNMTLLAELRDTVLAKNEALVNEINLLKTIMTPRQVAQVFSTYID